MTIRIDIERRTLQLTTHLAAIATMSSAPQLAATVPQGSSTLLNGVYAPRTRKVYREVVYRLQERLAPYEIQFDFRRYQETVCEPLKALSREVALLQTALRESRRQERVPFKTPIEVGEQVAFQIFAVGSAVDGETEVLVAMPTSQQCSLDFHQVQEECDVDGFWFPFQLSYRDPEMGELIFVVDQDGTVGIYTNNFPEAILRRVRKILKAIAGKLYCRDTSEA